MVAGQSPKKKVSVADAALGGGHSSGTGPLDEGVVESEFVRPVLLGESMLPYRVLPPCQAVLPLDGATLLDGEHPRLDHYPAEQQWLAGRSSDRLTLTGVELVGAAGLS
ncbi:MAG: hypothetical protein JWN52_7914 [Actinomycetia bacterium]|nr:hypothetical protein [Actinomycetes bacterium]